MTDEVIQARNFLETFAASLDDLLYDKAKQIGAKLTALIINHFATNAEEVKLFADKIQEEKRIFESIAMYDASSALFRRSSKGATGLEGIAG